MIASGTPTPTALNATGTMATVMPGQTPDEQAPIDSGSFWPAIQPARARQEMRLDGTVTPARLRAALVESIALVNSQLDAWHLEQQARGVTTLSASTDKRIDQISLNDIRYQRAVQCYAAANLQERLRNYDTTAEGHKRADALTDPIDDHRRDARWAVSDILGKRRTVVELI